MNVVGQYDNTHVQSVRKSQQLREKRGSKTELWVRNTKGEEIQGIGWSGHTVSNLWGVHLTGGSRRLTERKC